MSAIAAAAGRPAESPLRWGRDTLLLTARNLRSIPRVPARLLDVTIQPIVFILLFLYVFGSAIHVPGSATPTTCSRGSSASRWRSA